MRAPALLLAFLVALVAATTLRDTLFPLDARLYDLALWSRAPRPSEKIVIVGLDKKFLAGRVGSFTPRDKLARLVDVLASGKPRAIGLDVWLDSRIDEAKNGVDEQLRAALLRAKRAKIPVFLADATPQENAEQNGVNARVATLPFFKVASAGAGSVLFSSDIDGVVRNLSPENSAPTFARLLAQKIAPQQVQVALEKMRDGPLPLDFRGPGGTIEMVPASKILENPILAFLLENRVVLVGATTPESFDFFQTPFSVDKKNTRHFYGVEANAHAALTLAEGAPRASHESFPARFLSFGLAFLMALPLALLGFRGAIWGALGALVVAALSGVLSFQSAQKPFFWGFVWLPYSTFLITALGTPALAVAWRQLTQARELSHVRDAFGAYVGDEVLENLGGKMPELGGELREIAVLFCDIRGYSALAETMANDPKELLAELNAHFEPLVGALKERGAYTDNYVGDLVMALFGAPSSRGNLALDTQNAVLAALDFVRLVEERNVLRKQNGQLPIEIGVGLHCGEAVVGNLGTRKHRKIHYTAIGDVVNVASRIESATRGFDVPLLVSEDVVLQTREWKESPKWKFVAETRVKGRDAPVKLFRVAGNP